MAGAGRVRAGAGAELRKVIGRVGERPLLQRAHPLQPGRRGIAKPWTDVYGGHSDWSLVDDG